MLFAYGAVTLYGCPFQNDSAKRILLMSKSVFFESNDPATPIAQRKQAITYYGFGLFPFRSPLLRESLRFLFLALLRCFSSRRSLLFPIYSERDILGLAKMGFPIRIPPDHSLIDSSPKRLAAFRLLHRLLMPRHPPKALFN
jgi:hypothetical protein